MIVGLFIIIVLLAEDNPWILASWLASCIILFVANAIIERNRGCDK